MQTSHLAEQYEAEVLTQLANSDRETLATNVRIGLGTVIYGSTVNAYLKQAIEANDTTPETAKRIATGIDILCQAADRSERGYRGDSALANENMDHYPGRVSDEARMAAERNGGQPLREVLSMPAFQTHLAKLQEAAREGVIRLMPIPFWMDPYTATGQVRFANDSFGVAPSGTQLFMARANYAAFTPKTMATGESLLAGSGQNGLTEWTERGLQESMPHLTLSNMGIGELISAMLQKMDRVGSKDPVTIIDTGSGTGSTLAGSILGISDAISKGVNADRKLSILGIEGTLPFFNTLPSFIEAANGTLRGHGAQLQTEVNRSGEVKMESGKLAIVYSDILEAIQKLELNQENKEGITVVTANYVWHRLPMVIKKALIQTLKRKCDNLVFLVADLVMNGSIVNRGYFDFRDNGLLNCGNIGLAEMMHAEGFKITAVNENTAAGAMNPELARRIGLGTTSDSIFYLAYQGEKIRSLVEDPSR